LKKNNIMNVLIIGELYSLLFGMNNMIHRVRDEDLIVKMNKVYIPYEDSEYKQIVEKYNFTFISTKEVFRLGESYRFFIDGTPIIFDTHHFTLKAAKEISRFHRSKILEFLSK